jgi:hypothetical protein
MPRRASSDPSGMPMSIISAKVWKTGVNPDTSASGDHNRIGFGDLLCSKLEMGIEGCHMVNILLYRAYPVNGPTCALYLSAPVFCGKRLMSCYDSPTNPSHR